MGRKVMINLCVFAAAGKMGRRVLSLALEDPKFSVVQALEHSKSEALGRDIGDLAGTAPWHLEVTGALAEGADVVVDFSTPDATMSLLESCVKHGTAMVIGTTGLSAEQIQAIKSAGRKIPILLSPNMSLGVNLLFKLAEIAAGVLGEDYDAEVVEAHHRFKKDSPSGTALRLVECIAKAREVSVPDVMRCGRKGNDLSRDAKEIGVHSMRVGDIVGDHTVFFGNMGECIELKHSAHTRDIFARGALHAAKFLAKAEPGFYEMKDILGI